MRIGILTLLIRIRRRLDPRRIMLNATVRGPYARSIFGFDRHIESTPRVRIRKSATVTVFSIHDQCGMFVISLIPSLPFFFFEWAFRSLVFLFLSWCIVKKNKGKMYVGMYYHVLMTSQGRVPSLVVSVSNLRRFEAPRGSPCHVMRPESESE